MPHRNKMLLAVDLGAGSGRVVAGHYDGSRLELSELHRFPNDPVKESTGWHWNLDALLAQIKQGIALAVKKHGNDVVSLGVDTWGVDYGLINARGNLLGAPFQYRDARTQGMQELAASKMPRREIYERTGIHFNFFNTLFQLLAEAKAPARLDQAARLLFMPDLAHYLLTGVCVNEKSIASTSQLLNPRTQQWDFDLIKAMGLPERIFAPMVDAGTEMGGLRSEVAAETGAAKLCVLAPAGHDTACAVAGVPAEEPEPVFLSSGTWSLFGRELRQPIISDASYEGMFSNEGGVFGTTRFLKTIAGMWLVQECKRVWDAATPITYDDLMARAACAPPFAACLDPNAPAFEAPENMPDAIAAYGRRTGQTMPQEPAALTRVILESLALKYRFARETLAQVTGKPIHRLHIIGGGCQNNLLNQFTADALGCEVVAGPVEATSLGNMIMQLRALNEIHSLQEARAVVRRSAAPKVFTPKNTARWDDAAARFGKLLAQ